MPQDLDLDIPLPARISSYRTWVGPRTLAWVRAHDLIRSEAAERRFLAWDLVSAAARTYANAATREDLLKLANFFAMGFLLDDQVDPGAPDRLDRFEQVIHEMIAIPLRPPAAPLTLVCPVTVAWRELWEQMTGEMSPHWCDRFSVSYGQFLASNPYEARLLAGGDVPDVTSYVALRQVTVGIRYCLDQTEWGGRYELAPQVLAYPLFTALRDSVVDTVAWMNDLHSVERETAHGDSHNLLIVLQRRCGLSYADALDRSMSMLREALRRFLRLRDQVPGMVAELGLNTAQRWAVTQSLVGMENWIRGNHDWARTSGRYRVSRDSDQREREKYAEDVIS